MRTPATTDYAMVHGATPDYDILRRREGGAERGGLNTNIKSISYDILMVRKLVAARNHVWALV